METKEDPMYEHEPTIQDKTDSLLRLLEGRSIDPDPRVDKMIRLYGTVTDNKKMTAEQIEEMLERFELPITTDSSRIRSYLMPPELVERVPFYNQKLVNQYQKFVERSSNLMKMTHRLTGDTDDLVRLDLEQRIFADRQAASTAIIGELKKLLDAVQEGIDEHRQIYGHYQTAVLEVQAQTRVSFYGLEQTDTKTEVTDVETFQHPLLTLLRWSQPAGLEKVNQLRQRISEIASDETYQALDVEYQATLKEIQKYPDPKASIDFLTRKNEADRRRQEHLVEEFKTDTGCESISGACVTSKLNDYDQAVVEIEKIKKESMARAVENEEKIDRVDDEWAPLNKEYRDITRQIRTWNSIDLPLIEDYAIQIRTFCSELTTQPYFEMFIDSMIPITKIFNDTYDGLPELVRVDLFKSYINQWRTQINKKRWYRLIKSRLDEKIGVKLIGLFANHKLRLSYTDFRREYLDAPIINPDHLLSREVEKWIKLKKQLTEFKDFVPVTRSNDVAGQLRLLGFRMESSHGDSITVNPADGDLSLSHFMTIAYHSSLEVLRDINPGKGEPFHVLFIPKSEINDKYQLTKNNSLVKAIKKFRINSLIEIYQNIDMVVPVFTSKYSVHNKPFPSDTPPVQINTGRRFIAIPIVGGMVFKTRGQRGNFLMVEFNGWMSGFHSLLKDHTRELTSIIESTRGTEVLANQESIDGQITPLTAEAEHIRSEMRRLMESQVSVFENDLTGEFKETPLNVLGDNPSAAKSEAERRRENILRSIDDRIKTIKTEKDELENKLLELMDALNKIENYQEDRAATLNRLHNRSAQVEQTNSLRQQMDRMVIDGLSEEDDKKMFEIYTELFDHPFDQEFKPSTLFRLMMKRLTAQALEMNKKIRNFHPHLYGKMSDLNDQLSRSKYIYNQYLTAPMAGGGEEITQRFTEPVSVIHLFDEQTKTIKQVQKMMIDLNQKLEELKRLISKSNGLIDRYQRYSFNGVLAQISLLDSMVWALNPSNTVTQTIDTNGVIVRERLLNRFQSKIKQSGHELDDLIFRGLSQNYRVLLSEFDRRNGNKWHRPSETDDLRVKGKQRVSWIWFEYFTSLMAQFLGVAEPSRDTAAAPAATSSSPPAPRAGAGAGAGPLRVTPPPLPGNRRRPIAPPRPPTHF